jgi:L-lactate utilization protein LutB
MSDRHRTWIREELGKRCVRRLRRNGFDAHYAETAEAAAKRIRDRVNGLESFGFGGSATTRALGLPQMLREAGKIVHDHWSPEAGRSDLDIRLAQGRCDCFLCSANAISLTGEIVNVDGVGNRNNAMTFGCPHVVIVAGMNKVVHTLDAALSRVREVAAPMRAKSLDMKTPCAETGLCADCDSPQRICRVTTILHRKPAMTEVTVVLVGESLGF